MSTLCWMLEILKWWRQESYLGGPQVTISLVTSHSLPSSTPASAGLHSWDAYERGSCGGVTGAEHLEPKAKRPSSPFYSSVCGGVLATASRIWRTQTLDVRPILGLDSVGGGFSWNIHETNWQRGPRGRTSMHLELLRQKLKAHEEIEYNRRHSGYLSHGGIQTQRNRNHNHSEYVLKTEYMLGTVPDDLQYQLI